MAFVVTDSCINCRYTDCVEVCPVDCFHMGSNYLVINPDECIDCALCEPECPVEAIKPEDALKEDEQHFMALNAELAQKWPVIDASQEPLPEAEQWRDKHNKLAHLIR